MDYLDYTQWQNTADTLHMLLQITGKVKLERSMKRPEWAHIRQYMTLEGLSAGLIPYNEIPFEIRFNFKQDKIEFKNYAGKTAEVRLEDGKPVSTYYREMMSALKKIDAPTPIYVRPQEFYDPLDFDKDDKHNSYDKKAVLLWLDNMIFAYEALNFFRAPLRGKSTGPAYYFGTMDLTCILFSGEEQPLRANKNISAHAFDEKSYECGFWPGDPNFTKAAFFGMPYPFIKDLQGHENLLRPDKTFFKPEKQEIFLTLEDALSYKNPKQAVVEFCRSGLQVIQKITPWKYYDWIAAPLKYAKV